MLREGLLRAQPSSLLCGPAEKPGPPRSIRLLDVWNCNATLACNSMHSRDLACWHSFTH